MTATDRLGRSRASAGHGYFGPLPDDIWELVDKAWHDPPSIQSNFSRGNAHLIALASSLGWISIVSPDGQSLSRSWHCTTEGLTALRNRNLME